MQLLRIMQLSEQKGETMNPIPESIRRLRDAGFSFDDAIALRRISMTLHRWHELECGDGNNYSSWSIVRGHKDRDGTFRYDDAGKPYLERHFHDSNKPRYEALSDREKGAQKRLLAIVNRYRGWSGYIQTDPRGCALYMLPPGVTEDRYNSGIAVYK